MIDKLYLEQMGTVQRWDVDEWRSWCHWCAFYSTENTTRKEAGNELRSHFMICQEDIVKRLDGRVWRMDIPPCISVCPHCRLGMCGHAWVHGANHSHGGTDGQEVHIWDWSEEDFYDG